MIAAPAGTCLLLDSADALRSAHECLASLAEPQGAARSLVQHPDWLHYELARRGAAVRPHVLLVHDAQGRPIGYAPLLSETHRAAVQVGRWRLPLYRGRVLRLLGGTVVAGVAERAEVERQVALALRASSVRVLRLQESPLPNPLAQALAEAGFAVAAANLLPQRAWQIAPQGSPASYLAGLGAKKRNDLTRRVRAVYRKLGERAQLRVFTRAEDFLTYGALMNQVYARSWHARARPIDWCEPARLALFQQLARQQRIVAHLLMLGDRPIAYVHGYRLGGRYQLDDTGYDEAYAPLGVGSALVLQAVLDLIERHPGETIDFGYGDNQYKRVLASESSDCGELYLLRGWRARLGFAPLPALRWFYRQAHRLRCWWQQHPQASSLRGAPAGH